MGIIIKATSIIEDVENQGSVELTVKAAKQCIASAGISMEDIGILINLGIYKEDNIGEPAMAALIQKQLRLNADPVKQSPAEKTTFCFDLLNGSCGFLNAMQVLGPIMKNDQIKYALIVSSDVHPSRNQVTDFPYSPYGAAVIVTHVSEENKGFKNIAIKTSKNDGYTGVFGYHDFLKCGKEGRHHVIVEIDDDYINRLQKFAVKTVKEYIDSEKIDLSNVKLISSEPVKDFGKDIAKMIGLNEDLVVKIHETHGDPHTAALSIGYHLALNQNKIKEGDKVLFVGASSGLTSACGLYLV